VVSAELDGQYRVHYRGDFKHSNGRAFWIDGKFLKKISENEEIDEQNDA